MNSSDYKILLVEDEPELVQLFSNALKNEGFKMELATDGHIALKKIAEFKPDLMLLDLVIPQLDGFQVLEKIKKEKQDKKMLVYVWSNLTQESEIGRAKKLGASGYLIKSDYTPTKLVAKIKEILRIQ
ncbi:MAG: response regulator [Patescibacteria group bacterium]